jgi:hypothetical protein
MASVCLDLDDHIELPHNGDVCPSSMAPATIAKNRDRPQLRSPVLLPCRHRASGRLVQSVGELLPHRG